MNTKTFAQTARRILLKGVSDKLRYWGFDMKGNIMEEPMAVGGGVMFRGEAFDDPGLMQLWNSLSNAIRKKGIEQIIEETAYTWFNRIMAIRILSKNGYDTAQLEYAEGGQKLPLILQRARRGTYPFLSNSEQGRLSKINTDFSKETEAFAILLKGYCHSHILLNNVFGNINDYTELLLPDNILSDDGFVHLLNMTDAISDEDYKEVELIGWLYQFYISEKKDEVFASFKKNKKAEAKDIPAATQIFTPNWIVKYMVQNTVGKIWLDLHPDSDIKSEMKYLVEGENPEYGDPIIAEVAQLKLLDPAVGSGHIMVEGFDLLYKMYEAEYYPPDEAVESILKNNLYGLDIDMRAVQLARFAVLLKAAQFYPEVLNKGWLPNIYAMPEPRDFSRQEVLDFLGAEGVKHEEALSKALRLMQQAQNLGSIMQFDLEPVAIDYIRKRWQALKVKKDLSFYEHSLLPALNNFVEVLFILCDHYEAVVANPPYMTRKNMNKMLYDYLARNYKEYSNEFYSVFTVQQANLCKQNGRIALICLPAWMFLPSFKQLRKKLIFDLTIDSFLHLGRGIFGSDFGSCSFVVINSEPNDSTHGQYFRLFKAQGEVNSIEKIEGYFFNNSSYKLSQKELTIIPGTPIVYWIPKNLRQSFLVDYKSPEFIESMQGVRTGMDSTFIRFWHEVSLNKTNLSCTNSKDCIESNKTWFPVTRGGDFRKWYGNLTNVINFQGGGENIAKISHDYRLRNPEYYFKEGASWTAISASKFAVRFTPKGILFGSGGPMFFPKNENDFYSLIAFFTSCVCEYLMNIINPTINYTKNDIDSLPIKKAINSIESSNISIQTVGISKKDWDSQETSWGFEKTLLINENNSLEQDFQIWQKNAIKDFFQLHKNEEELNRIFIDIYGLQDELIPDVALKDITILQEELDRNALEALEPVFRERGSEGNELPIKRDVVMQQFISYAVGVFMGRYRLDIPGLHIAHPDASPEEISSYTYNGHQVEIDEDAIIPLMGSAGEFPDDAVLRFKEFLDIIWGADTRTENMNFLQECLNKDLEKYLVKDFWKDHCQRYKKKPIYWLFSSSKGAFQVLVYMHRMNAFTVEKIRANYLLPHLKHLRAKISHLENNEASLSSQEARQLDNLRKDLMECESYELLIKDMANRQITFDLDDGVTENYKLFDGVVAPIK